MGKFILFFTVFAFILSCAAFSEDWETMMYDHSLQGTSAPEGSGPKAFGSYNQPDTPSVEKGLDAAPFGESSPVNQPSSADINDGPRPYNSPAPGYGITDED
ncbi:MAG: hypothetical protein PHO00_00550 [bacterium]|nr:hypothetical protein [bacterium]